MLITYSQYGVLLWDPLQNLGGLAIEGSSGLQVHGQEIEEGWHQFGNTEDDLFTFGYPELGLGGWAEKVGREVVVIVTGLVDPSGMDTFWLTMGPDVASFGPGDISRHRWTAGCRVTFHQDGKHQVGEASCHIDNSWAIEMVAHCPAAEGLRELSLVGRPLPGRRPVLMPGQTLKDLQQYCVRTLDSDPVLEEQLGCRGSGGKRF